MNSRNATLLPTFQPGDVLRIAVLALCYALAGQASFAVSVSHGIVTLVVFAAEGFALAATILFGPRLWLGVFFGQWVLALFNGLAWPVALGVSAVNALEAVIGGWLFIRLGLRRDISRVRDILGLLGLIFLVLQPFSASLGHLVLFAGGIVAPNALLVSWGSWWFGNSMGQILIVPLLLSLAANWGNGALQPWRLLWVAALVGLTGVLLLSGAAWVSVAVVFAVLTPLLVFLAARHGMAEACLGLTIFSIQALLFTRLQHGPFWQSGQALLLDLNILLLGEALIVLLVSALLGELRRSTQLRGDLLEQIHRIEGEVPGVIYQYRLKPDGTQEFPYVSAGISQLCAVSVEQVLADASILFDMIHPQDLPGLLRSVEASARQLTPWRQEYRAFVAGRERWLQANATPRREASGAVLWHGFLTDVTERRQADEALQDKARALAEASQAKSRFLASMSHELRTPLNAVIGFTGRLIATDEGAFSPRQREALFSIERNGRHLLGIINDLLDMARIESGQLEIQLDRVAPGDVLLNLKQQMAALAEQKGLRLQFEPVDPDLILLADAKRLLQILINLLGNAIKFCAQGQVSVSAVSATRHACAGVLFCVADTGPGIASEALPRLFLRFSRLDSRVSERVEGAGLGLSLVRELSELHGGEVWVESQLGHGSQFYVWLPMAPQCRLG